MQYYWVKTLINSLNLMEKQSTMIQKLPNMNQDHIFLSAAITTSI